MEILNVLCKLGNLLSSPSFNPYRCPARYYHHPIDVKTQVQRG